MRRDERTLSPHVMHGDVTISSPACVCVIVSRPLCWRGETRSAEATYLADPKIRIKAVAM